MNGLVPNLNNQNRELDTGIVTSIQGTDALVTIDTQAACDSCNARIICVPDKAGKRILKAINPLNAKVGSRVVVSETSTFLLKLSFLQYGIPLIGFLMGIILCYILDISSDLIANELIWFAGGVVGLAIAAILARYFAERMVENKNAFFIISRILS
jgi:sigma-E factor negative regulatory protein RseC